MDGTDERGANPGIGGQQHSTDVRRRGWPADSTTVTKDTEVPSQVNAGREPGPALGADRQARKDF